MPPRTQPTSSTLEYNQELALQYGFQEKHVQQIFRVKTGPTKYLASENINQTIPKLARAIDQFRKVMPEDFRDMEFIAKILTGFSEASPQKITEIGKIFSKFLNAARKDIGNYIFTKDQFAYLLNKHQTNIANAIYYLTNDSDHFDSSYIIKIMEISNDIDSTKFLSISLKHSALITSKTNFSNLIDFIYNNRDKSALFAQFPKMKNPSVTILEKNLAQIVETNATAHEGSLGHNEFGISEQDLLDMDWLTPPSITPPPTITNSNEILEIMQLAEELKRQNNK